MRFVRSVVASLLVLGLTGCGSGGGGGGTPAEPKRFTFFDVFTEVGLEPGKVQVVDVDCDGRVDIVTHCPGDSSISVLRRPPNIGSSGQDGVGIDLRHMLVPDSARDFCLADLDLDGLPDLAVITGDPDFDLLVFRNDPKSPGTFFLSSPSFLVGGGISRVAAGDLNGDGVPDLVCLAEATGQATLLLNDRLSPGSLLPGLPLPSFGGRSEQLILNDYNITDSGPCPNLLAPGVITLTGGALSFLAPSPGGTFTQKTWLPANFRSPFRMAMGDVTGDGLDDIVLASGEPAAPAYCVLEQDRSSAAGFRESPSLPSLGRCRALALADMNRDGALDLVARETDASGVSTLTVRVGIRESPTRFDAEVSVHSIGSSGQDGVSVEIGDWNRDGFFDVFTELPLDGTVQVHQRVGSAPAPPSFARDVQLDSPQAVTWVDVRVGDLNGDGRTDFVTCGTDGITCHFQDPGSPVTFHSATFAPTSSAQSLAIGDVDRDGWPDIAFASSDQIGVLWHNAAGAEQFDAPTIFGMGALCRDVAIADLDVDGNLDLVTTRVISSQGTIAAVFRQPGTPRGFAGGPVTTSTSGPILRALAVADLDCDGRPDVVCPSGPEDTLAIARHAPGLPPPGTGLFLPPELHPFAGGVRVAVGDVNGDGRPDIVTAEGDGVTLTLAHSSGQGSFGSFRPSVKLGFGVVVVAGDPDFDLLDVDRDGDLDIVAMSPDADGDAFRILLNDRDAVDGFRRSYVIPHVLERSGVRIATGDVDGDGWADVVTLTGRPVGQPGSSLFVWRQIAGPR